FVILKSNGYPTYNFAVVVDDYEMGITHVIRGEEWLSSLPKHEILYDYFGWDKPLFYHTPSLRNPDKSKLSKRQGHTSVSWYKDEGYLPEAILNFLALLGWSHPEEKEEFSLSEFIGLFDPKDLKPVGPIFDLTKLEWLNGVWIRKKDIQEIVDLSKPYFEKMNVKFDQDYLSKIIILIRDRLKYLSQIPELTDYFFNEGKLDKEKLVFKKSTAEATKKGLEAAENKLSAQDKWPNDVEDFNKLLAEVVSENSLLNGDVFWPIRYSLSFSEASPSPAELLWALPKDVSISRIKTAIDTL
ncbi:MAG: Glutamate-tRNA ligase, partial [candidate division CPR2 bacterium GW2011_GWC1_39_9]